ncbi:MAG TPA: hypothetical protein VM716_04395 [Gemmatimonadales bacterium]|nr:hypothetical protein [Gemmatimonadales bacterium]
MILFLLQLVAVGWQSGGPDSLAVLKAARRAQELFEFTRGANLPERRGGWNGVCEEPIGRMCYWYDGSVDTAPPEPQRIRHARARLIGTLDSAGAALPGDDWIAGQRVRYLLEDSQPQGATLVAEQCRATRWWCEALRGLVQHVTGDFAGADSSFTAALRVMPEGERCRWTNISSLLEGDLAGRYRRWDCAARAAFEQRWWWLTQPLWSRPGNDRRTEHFARLTMARIEEGRRTAFGLYWADDLRDVMLRYGWPTFWTREPQDYLAVSAEPKITGHDPSPAFHFAPRAHAFDHPEGATPEDWTLDPPRARERYAPAYAASVHALEDQVSIFRRRDSCIVVAAYDLSADTAMAGQSVRAALVLASDEHDRVVTEHQTRLDRPDVLVAAAPCGPRVLSLEVIAPTSRRVARTRHSAALDEHALVSDLLLVDAGDSLPTALAPAIPTAHASKRVRVDRPLGLYWEVYGLRPDGEEVKTSATVTRQGGGFLRRAVEAVGLAGHHRNVSLEWAEVLVPGAADPHVAGRALALDLSSLSLGRYRIEVTVTAHERAPVTLRRDIELVRP